MSSPADGSRRRAIEQFLRSNFALILVVALGIGLRIAVDNVTRFSPADEAHYVEAARRLAAGGWSSYPSLVADYLRDPRAWLFPTPLRWGYLALATSSCMVGGACNGSALAGLSLLAGVLGIVLTYLVGLELLTKRGALLAAAFSITSPLQLAMGRRALQDEVYCAAFLATLWAFLRWLRRTSDQEQAGEAARSPARSALFVVLATVAFSVKETQFIPYWGLVLIYLLADHGRPRRWRDGLLLLAPPLLYFVGFVVSSRSWSAFFKLVTIERASFLSHYSLQYQAGPPHRPLFDLFLLAPVVSLLAAGAAAMMAARIRLRHSPGGERWLLGFTVYLLLAFAGLPKNARFSIIVDPLVRLLAAWAVVALLERRSAWVGWVGVVAALNALSETWLFGVTFIRHDTYDPVTQKLLGAQGALPGGTTSPMWPHWPVAFPLAAGLAAAAAIGYRRWRGHVRSPPKREQGDGSRDGFAWSLCLSVPFAVGLGLLWLLPKPAATPVANGISAVPAASAPVVDPMAAGLDALYTRRDPEAAAAFFRQVLKSNPHHYGATFQLARALDELGGGKEADQLWRRVLDMAIQYRDSSTADLARKRLGAINAPQNKAAPPPASAR